MIRRRAFTALAMIGVPWPTSISARTAARIYRVGVLNLGNHGEEEQLDFKAFVAELARRGYIESRNLVLEKRIGSVLNVEQANRLAAELVRLKVDVIYSIGGSSSARVAMRATTSIPIVFDSSADAVAAGLVSSLAKPGGNVTGMSLQGGDQVGKALQYLAEAAGRLTSFAYITTRSTRSAPWFPGMMAGAVRAASALGIQMQFVDVESMSDFEPAVQRLVGVGVNGISILTTDAFSGTSEVQAIAAVFLKYRLPSVGPVGAGFLIAFGNADGQEARAAAKFVDKILQGAKPAELPVEQPTEWVLEINLKTAKALGLEIPKSLLLRATKVVA
jgi:putative tryptophan/tyrosine transport system substrate-binding protein